MPGQNRWSIYVGAFVLACLVFAAPCIYALQAHSSGRLLWLSVNGSSMEPTLESGEYLLADKTYGKLLDKLAEKQFAHLTPPRSRKFA